MECVMKIIETEAKSILTGRRRTDSWFLALAGMNIYRGCLHACVYCDGRAEKYRGPEDFGNEVTVKTNAPLLLARALDPARKRKPLPRGFIMLGGGVGDSYQKIEEKYRLTEAVLRLLLERGRPVHILTKSTLVLRDLELIKSVHNRARAIVSMSFSSVDDGISAAFEPGVPPPSERLEVLGRFKAAGIPCGMFLMPVIPFITDTQTMISDSVKAAADAGLDFIIFGGMTLKGGRQQDCFYNLLDRRYADLRRRYETLYPGDPWGNARPEYYDALGKRFFTIAREYGIPQRMPQDLFSDQLELKERITVILEHIDYYARALGMNSPYRQAARSIGRLDIPPAEFPVDVTGMPGIGPFTAKIVREIIAAGRSSFLDKLSRS